MDGICFSDQGWLQYFFSTYGVNRLECDCRVQSCRTWRESNKQGKAKAYCAHASILLYFAQSPFYDKSCSNERLRSIEYDPHLEERLRWATKQNFFFSPLFSFSLFLLFFS
mmetsp:Transcript_17226/g.42923  ORF Transcript_17226/g.42923 Transcript_17226/m.42923 type:complete len:111 (-) Transcript_17226:27-359(-)